MNKQRFAVIIVALIGLIATFLPWYKIVQLGTISGMSSSGWFTFIMFIIVIILALRKDLHEDLSMGISWSITICSLLHRSSFCGKLSMSGLPRKECLALVAVWREYWEVRSVSLTEPGLLLSPGSVSRLPVICSAINPFGGFERNFLLFAFPLLAFFFIL